MPLSRANLARKTRSSPGDGGPESGLNARNRAEAGGDRILNGKQVLEIAVDAWNRKDVDGFVSLAAPDAKVSAAGGLDPYGG